MSEQNKAVVRRLVEEHWNKKNAALVSELFTSNVSLQTPDGVLTGLDGASTLLKVYETAFPDFRLTIEKLIGDGDEIVWHWTFTGTHTGALGNIPATGRRVSPQTGIAIFRITSGKVSQGLLVWDKFALLQQLGVVGETAAT